MIRFLILLPIRIMGLAFVSIGATLDGVNLDRMKYYGYSKRDAVRLYREKYNLKYKKLVKVEY